MSLLWTIMMDPEAPLEVSKSPAITDALQAYAYRKGRVDNQIIYEYMKQCTSQIQAGISVLPAMNLLHRLVYASVSHSDTCCDWQDLEALLTLKRAIKSIVDTSEVDSQCM